MTRTNAASCPWCGAVLQLVTDGFIGKLIHSGFHNPETGEGLREELVSRPFIACSGCEFCIEVLRG